MILLLQMADSQVQNVNFPRVFMFTINSLRPEMQAEEVDFATRLKGRTTNTGSSGSQWHTDFWEGEMVLILRYAILVTSKYMYNMWYYWDGMIVI